jgi:hypothetical protein
MMKKQTDKATKKIAKIMSTPPKKEKLTPEQQKVRAEDEAHCLLAEGLGHYFDLGKTLDEVIEIVMVTGMTWKKS